MDNLKANLPHMTVAIAIIAAAVVLLALGKITSGEGITLIAGAGGFSMGAGAGSSSAPAAPVTASLTSHSNGETTATLTPSSLGPVVTGTQTPAP